MQVVEADLGDDFRPPDGKGFCPHPGPQIRDDDGVNGPDHAPTDRLNHAPKMRITEVLRQRQLLSRFAGMGVGWGVVRRLVHELQRARNKNRCDAAVRTFSCRRAGFPTRRLPLQNPTSTAPPPSMNKASSSPTRL